MRGLTAKEEKTNTARTRQRTEEMEPERKETNKISAKTVRDKRRTKRDRGGESLQE